MRITPRITPFVPKPRYYSPKHLARSGLRSIATGNIARPRIGGSGLRVLMKPPKPPKAAVSALKQQSSSGTKSKGATGYRRPSPARRKPIRRSRAGIVKIPSSFSHPRVP